MIRRFLAIVLLLVAIAVVPSPLDAASVAASGWWTSSPVPAPDGSSGLIVQGGPDVEEPMAYAAVSFKLAGETPSSLELTLVSGSASTPNTNLQLCPLDNASFTESQGGPIADAPQYSDANCVEASPSSDGTSYTFDDVAGLAGTDALAVAILPTMATDRVVIAKPGGDALTTTPAPSSSPGSTETSEPPFASEPSFSATPSYTPATGSFDVPSYSAPAVEPDTARADTPAAESSAAPSVTNTAASAPLSDSDDDSRVPAIVFVVLVLLAATLWMSASRTASTEPVPE